jgi:hypothetical protein
LAGDYELTLRLLKKYRIKVFYYPETLVVMRAGGRSGQNLQNRRAGWRELKRAWTSNGLAVPTGFIWRRLFFKLKQYLV